MKVLLIGASGFSGQAVLEKLLQEGHEVTAITRKSGSIQSNHKNLHIQVGNVLDPVFIKRVVTDQEAVINCLGIGGKGSKKPNSLISDSTRILVEAMEKSSVKRLISMSNVGAGDSKTFHPWFFRVLILPVFMKWLKYIIDDKNRMEPIIMKSGLDWVIVRCPNITDKPATGTITPSLDGKNLKLSITNPDLASFLVQQLRSNDYLKQTPSISN